MARSHSAPAFPSARRTPPAPRAPLLALLALPLALLLAGCLDVPPALNATPTLPPRFNATTLDDSVAVARAFVEQSSTFACSGVADSLAFEDARALDTPYAWTIAFTYTARVVQYGCPDLSSPAMAFRRIEVTVDQGAVTRAVVDERYDELARGFLPEPDGEPGELSLAQLIQRIQENYPQTQGIAPCGADVGCETDILSRPVRDGWRVVFFRGAGDCQAGCIERHYYHFLAYADGRMDYQGETDRYVDDAEGQFCGGIAAIPCPAGYACRFGGEFPDAGGACAKTPGACATSADCAPTGCSGEVCAPRDQPAFTTCEYRPEYACYDNPAECGCVNNQCAWSERVRECAFETQNQPFPH